MASILLIFSVASIAQAELVIDLVAVQGAGYTVSADGKHVEVLSPGASVAMQLKAVFGPTEQDPTNGLFKEVGVILSQQAAGGGLAAGTLASTLVPAFATAGAFPGKSQALNGDGVGDVGITGTMQPGPPQTWTASGGTSSDWITPSQTAVPAGTPIGAPGTQVLGNLTLTGIQGQPGATTSFEYIPRTGTGNHVYRLAGVDTRGYPAVGAPVSVTIFVPEPSTLVLLGMGVVALVALLRRRG